MAAVNMSIVPLLLSFFVVSVLAREKEDWVGKKDGFKKHGSHVIWGKLHDFLCCTCKTIIVYFMCKLICRFIFLSTT